MTVALASAWQPRGELERFLHLQPQLEGVYRRISITLPPDSDQEVVRKLAASPSVSVVVTPDWSWGRYMAVEDALQGSDEFIQYADLDRLVRWVEKRSVEWRETVAALQRTDCLIIGRTDRAYQTHPQALRSTERVANRVFSHLLGLQVDLSAGSKGFSREAAQFLIASSRPGRALGTDAEWPVLLYRAGYDLKSVFVDGLDWESADRYRQLAADADLQKVSAEAYDRDPRNWARRVAVSQEIINAGLDAWDRMPESLKG
jgi:hypothetical protein